ncbi:hypothetical protein [Paenibacillus melissococcoides]|uniref:hypothetical protein n=1 Tax=Paenibacillus melissococcoides TaxID=2912268 RepID=UPI0038B3F2B9
MFFRKRRFGAIGTPAAASCAAKLQLTLLVVLPEAPVRRDRHAGGASCAGSCSSRSWLFFRKRRFGAIGSPAAASCAAKLQLTLLVVLPEAPVRRDRLAGSGQLRGEAAAHAPGCSSGSAGSARSARRQRPVARRSCSSRSWLFFRKRWFGAIGTPAAASCAAKLQLTLLVVLPEAPVRRDRHAGSGQLRGEAAAHAPGCSSGSAGSARSAHRQRPAARRSCSSRSWLFFRKRRFGAIGTPAAASCAAKLQLALLVVLPEALVRRDRHAGSGQLRGEAAAHAPGCSSGSAGSARSARRRRQLRGKLQLALLVVLPEAPVRRDRHAGSGQLRGEAAAHAPGCSSGSAGSARSAHRQRPAARRSCSSRSWLFFRKRWFGAIGTPAAASCAAKLQLTLLVVLPEAPVRRDRHAGSGQLRVGLPV